MKNKKIVSTLLAISMALSLAACTSPKDEPTPSQPATTGLTDGTYTAAAPGKNGDVNVTVTVSGGAISDVQLGEHSETPGIFEAPAERIPAAIVEHQSIAIDSVSGATYTSEAILKAVSDCIEQAGGDVKDFSTPVSAVTSDAVEEYETDVVVVGGGGAGAAAALSAVQKGAKVIVVEKSTMLGGSSMMSGGLGAEGSRMQKEANVSFTAGEWLKDWLDQQNYMVSAPMIYKYITESGETIDWMLDNGVEFDFVGHSQDALSDDPIASYHAWRNDEGGVYLNRMFDRVTENGGTIMLETAGTQVLMDNGKAVGILAQKTDGTTVKITAKAVILATGGYGASEEMMMELVGYKVNGINLGTQTGDGIRMGVEAGAATEGSDALEYHGAHAPFDLVEEANVPNGGENLNQLAVYAGALWVNADGYRFTNEDISFDSSYVGNVTAAQGDHYYALVDQKFIDTLVNSGAVGLGINQAGAGFGAPPHGCDELWTDLPAELEAGYTNGVTVKADTLEELAEKTGINVEHLLATVEEYNAFCAAGKDEMYGKAAQFLIPIAEGPYYMVMGRSTSLCTLGGLKITTDMEVVDTDNQIIPGLYSAGVDCSGSMYNKVYVSYEGVTMGWAMTSGRLAGENAAGYATK